MFRIAPWVDDTDPKYGSEIQKILLESMEIADGKLSEIGIHDDVRVEFENIKIRDLIASYLALTQFDYETLVKIIPEIAGDKKAKKEADMYCGYPVIRMNTNHPFPSDQGYVRNQLTYSLLHEYGHVIAEFFRELFPDTFDELKDYYSRLYGEEKYQAYFQFNWGRPGKKLKNPWEELLAEDFATFACGNKKYYPYSPETDKFFLFPSDKERISVYVEEYVKKAFVP